MQMSITGASPTPAAAGTGSASAKGTDGAAFNQALTQTIAGVQGGNGANGDSTAGTPTNGVTMNAITSLLGENLSAKDLLAAIEALIEKLNDTSAQDLSATTTEGKLTEALKQLDNLLSMLTGVPLLPQNELPQTDAQADDAQADDATDPNGALLALIASINAPVTQTASIQAAETSAANGSQAIVADLEAVNALKAGLQEALTDLRALLRDQKGILANRDQIAQIGKAVAQLESLINGSTTDAAAAEPVAGQANANDIVNAVRSLQATTQTNAHLQRLAYQAVHSSMLKSAQSSEANGSSATEEQTVNGTENVNSTLMTANLDSQRLAATTAKPVIAQPVPVQQFASTIQGLVVKQFNVSSTNGVSQAQLTLYPEHLGQVNVNISVQNGVLTAQFLTDTVSAKDMLENQMAQLRSALQSQGLQVDKLVVAQSSVQAQMFQDRQGQQGQQQQTTKRNKANDDAIGEIDFTTDLEEVSAQQAADRDLGLGRAIHTIA